jgi:hypothetical protein
MLIESLRDVPLHPKVIKAVRIVSPLGGSVGYHGEPVGALSFDRQLSGRDRLMNERPADPPSDPATDADNASDAMKDQLRGDVASWMAARSEAAGQGPVGHTVPAVQAQPPVAKPTRARHAKPAPAATEAAAVKKKPFGMSYDGMSQADYITYMISRGAR